MSNTITSKLYWVVVEVRSGIPAEISAFSTYEKANEYSESLRKNINLDNDETGIFEINLESIPS
jgi:hypothetical protein